MPRGAPCDKTERLNRVEDGYLLRREGGGTWRLDLGPWRGWCARRLLGRRVRVTGSPGDFDLLEVSRIARAPEQPRVRGPAVHRTPVES